MTVLEKPEPLQSWYDQQRERTSDELSYKEASGRQIRFVRDELAGIIACRAPLVIATYHSKSVELPVY